MLSSMFFRLERVKHLRSFSIFSLKWCHPISSFILVRRHLFDAIFMTLGVGFSFKSLKYIGLKYWYRSCIAMFSKCIS